MDSRVGKRALWLACLTISLGICELAVAQGPLLGKGACPPGPTGEALLSLADLEQLALHGNPTLAQAAAGVDEAHGRALQSGLCPNPTIGYVGEQIGLRGKSAPGELQGGFIDQVIVTGGKLRLNRAKFSQEIVMMEAEAAAQQYRVINGVRIRFYQLLAMQRLLKVREDLLKLADDIAKTTEELINVGQANRPDLLQARIEARQERVGLENARALYLAAQQQLAAFVGQPELKLDQLQGKLEEGPELPNYDAAMAHLLAASPEVQAANALVDRNQLGLKREQVEPIPNVNVRAATGYDFESRTVTSTVNVGIRLPIFDRNQGNIRAAEAQLGRAAAEVERVELSLRRRLSREYARYRTAKAVVENYRKFNLPEGKEAFQLYLDSFGKRRAAYPQVLIAQRNYFQISLDYVEALEKLRRSEVAILGLLLIDGLDEPAGPPGEGRFKRRESDGGERELPDPIRAGEGRSVEDRIGNRPGGE